MAAAKAQADIGHMSFPTGTPGSIELTLPEIQVPPRTLRAACSPATRGRGTRPAIVEADAVVAGKRQVQAEVIGHPLLRVAGEVGDPFRASRLAPRIRRRERRARHHRAALHRGQRRPLAGRSLSPQGVGPTLLPRAAYSHSASVGRCAPRPRQ